MSCPRVPRVAAVVGKSCLGGYTRLASYSRPSTTSVTRVKSAAGLAPLFIDRVNVCSEPTQWRSWHAWQRGVGLE